MKFPPPPKFHKETRIAVRQRKAWILKWEASIQYRIGVETREQPGVISWARWEIDSRRQYNGNRGAELVFRRRTQEAAVAVAKRVQAKRDAKAAEERWEAVS